MVVLRHLLIVILSATCYAASFHNTTVMNSLGLSRQVFASNSLKHAVSKETASALPESILIVSVTKSLLAMAKKDGSTAPRMVRLICGNGEPNEDSLLQTKFIAAYTTCRADSKITLEDLYSSKCPVDAKKDRISCSGYVESSGERTGQRLHCEPEKVRT
uniref:Uncharacterized protein n=1 Tax=Trichuris muris TaxID=70415 RepID=A0A5S6QVP5_TRIMR